MKYDEERRRAALARWDTLAKPLGGMGVFEEMIAQIEGMPAAQGGRRRRVLVFCADNGVVAEGVTQTGSEVTATVAANIARGAASVSLMARAAGAEPPSAVRGAPGGGGGSLAAGRRGDGSRSRGAPVPAGRPARFRPGSAVSAWGAS